MELNHWVQVTPDCAFLFNLNQSSGAPDPGLGPSCSYDTRRVLAGNR